MGFGGPRCVAQTALVLTRWQGNRPLKASAGLPSDQDRAFRAASPPRLQPPCKRLPHVPRRIGTFERILPMNPADIGQVAPVVSGDVSLIALFIQAHWVVKLVMLGLITCSVWVWAIA